MSPRPPSLTLIVDSNIILSVALGVRSRPSFDAVQASRELFTSEGARKEIVGRATGITVRGEPALPLAIDILRLVQIADETSYDYWIEKAEGMLRLAVPSRNGSTTDAHILALAWTLDADIWSHDRDFAGTGWPSWSNANLRAAIERESIT